MRRNISKTSGKQAKNFTQHLAQKRLEEVMPRVKTMLSNADYVNSAEVFYYSRSLRGKVCSCRKKSESPIENKERVVNETNLNKTRTSPVKVVHHGTQFGWKHEDKHTDNNFPNKDDDFDLTDDSSFVLGESVDCGICYRTGVVPGYILFGVHSSIIIPSSGNILEVEGYVLDTTTTPESLVKIRNDGFVAVRCLLPDPGVIEHVHFSVRNNKDILFGLNLLNPGTGQPIYDKESLLECIEEVVSGDGRTAFLFNFIIKPKQFTHINIDCYTGSALRANISEESTNLDYTTLNPLSDITLTMPAVISKVVPGDVVYVPSRKLCIRVNNYSRKNTAKFDFWEYTVSGRQIQPSESLVNLATQTILF